MPDAGMIHKQVRARIAELDAIMEPIGAEYDQLQRLAATFADKGTADAPSPPRSRRRRARMTDAAPVSGGNRSQHALRLISAQPGLTAAELAKAMGISRNYLYRVLPKLEQRGLVNKQGRGYHLAATPAAGQGPSGK